MTVNSPQKSRSPTRRRIPTTCNTTQDCLHTAHTIFATTTIRQAALYWYTWHTRTARRGRPFRHRCVELHSPLPQHFNARLPRSFLKQPHYGPVGAGLNSHLSPCHTQTRRLKNLQETLATDKPVSQWISPSALVKFAFTRLLGTEKRLGDFQPASKRTCCGGPACLWSVGLGRRVRGEGRD